MFASYPYSRSLTDINPVGGKNAVERESHDINLGAVYITRWSLGLGQNVLAADLSSFNPDE